MHVGMHLTGIIMIKWWCGGSLTWLRLVPSETTTTTECNLLTASCLWGVGSVLCKCVPGALLAGSPSPEWLGGWVLQGRPADAFSTCSV